MNKHPDTLNQVQDTVWNDPKLHADKWPDGSERTHCNQAWLKTCQGMGCHDFDPPAGGEPYTADQLWYWLQRKENEGKFLEKDMEDVQSLANQGSLVCAITPSWNLPLINGQTAKHGHICSITPGDQEFSGTLNKSVPVCLNISTEVLSSRRVGINYAFPVSKLKVAGNVKFYAWKELL